MLFGFHIGVIFTTREFVTKDLFTDCSQFLSHIMFWYESIAFKGWAIPEVKKIIESSNLQFFPEKSRKSGHENYGLI